MSSNKKIVVYSEFSSPRLEYATEIVLGNILGLEYSITSLVDDTENGVIIEYCEQKSITGGFHIQPAGILNEKGVKPYNPKVKSWNNLPVFFASNDDLGIDIFAIAFYLVSRYEEYNSINTDSHNRFDPVDSLAYKSGFLDIPLVDLLAIKLRNALENHFGLTLESTNKYRFRPTIDIDMAWVYKNRPIHILFGKLAKAFLSNKQEFERILDTMKGKNVDPFYTFDFLEMLEDKYGIEHHLFVQIGDFGKFDKNNSHKNKDFTNLLKKLSKNHVLGLHPSYQSNESIEILKREKKRLESICRVNSSRQHFLKLSLPHTYRNLISLGIKNDFTMGYAQKIGFRASIARPFKWYDLDEEKITDLTIHPFQIMDGTFKNYLKINSDDSLKAAKRIRHIIKEVNGEFSTIWHNSSFSHIEEWDKYGGLYEEILKQGVSKGDSGQDSPPLWAVDLSVTKYKTTK